MIRVCHHLVTLYGTDCGICHQSKHMHQYILNYLTCKNTAQLNNLDIAVHNICKVFGKSITHHQLWVESATLACLGILIPVIFSWRFLFRESNISLKPHIGLMVCTLDVLFHTTLSRLGGSFSCCFRRGP